MAAELSANKLSESVAEGFRRFEHFRKARASHIREYVDEYFEKECGITGDRPLNLVFLAVRSLVPSLVQKEGVTQVLTKILRQREYAEKLGLALTDLDEQLKGARLLRAAIVDMCFGMTTLKTSIAASGQMFDVATDVRVDPGQIYTERISLDDMTADPTCTAWDRASFIGHRIRIERNKLLDTAGFSHDVIARLPRAGSKAKDDRAEELSKDDNQSLSTMDLQDFVNVVELWVPEARAVCYIPDPSEATANDFLKIEDYYGPRAAPTPSALLPNQYRTTRFRWRPWACGAT
jgi:hypothetical protein